MGDDNGTYNNEDYFEEATLQPTYYLSIGYDDDQSSLSSSLNNAANSTIIKHSYTGNFEDYQPQTRSLRNEDAFQIAAIAMLVLLAILFQPTLRFLRRRRRRKRLNNEVKTNHKVWKMCREDLISKDCEISTTYNEEAIHTMFVPAVDGDDDIAQRRTRNFDTQTRTPGKFRRSRLRNHTAEIMSPESSFALLSAVEKEEAFGDEIDQQTAYQDNDGAGCFGYDLDDVFSNLDDFDLHDVRLVSDLVRHVNENGIGVDASLVPLFHTSILEGVHHNTGLLRNLLQVETTNDTDGNSDDQPSGLFISGEREDEDGQHDPNYYFGYSWDTLPIQAKLAGEALGYDQKVWDNDEHPPVAQRKWKDLSVAERAGCLELGFDRSKWDHDLPCLGHYAWKELHPGARLAAQKLGFTEPSWNSGRRIGDFRIPWKELNSELQLAALQLGYDQTNWDGRSSSCLSLSSGRTIEQYSDTAKDTVGEDLEVNKSRTTLSKVLTFDSESQALVRLSIPATAGSMISPILAGATKALIIVHLGPSLYLGWIMTNLFLDLSDSVLQGIAEAEEILNVQAVGMKNFFLAGQYTQLTVTLYALCAIPSYGLFASYIEEILGGLGFGNEAAGLAKAYIPFAVTGRLLHGCFAKGIGRLMWSEEKGRTMVVIEVLFNVSKVAGLIIILLGFKSKSIVVLGALELGSSILCTIAVYGYCEGQGWLEKYRTGLFGHLAIRNTALAKGVLKMAAPLTLGHVLSQGEWQLFTLFASAMGPAETVAWTIAESFWKILEEIPNGMRSAAEIRIGRNLGIDRPDTAKLVAYKSLLYSFSLSVSTSAVLILVREPLIELFTEDGTLFYMLDNLVPLLCIGNIIISLGSDARTILETQRRAKVAVLIYFFATLGITVPLATWLVFWGNFGLESLMMACVFGYSIMSFVMLSLVFTTNWPGISRRVILKSSRDHREMEALMNNKNSAIDFIPAGSVVI